MSSTREIKKPATDKKPRAVKTASHPPYFQMIKDALLALKEKGGSSPHAIAKFMEEKHKSVLPENFRKMLALQLKNSASKGKLAKVKASYKLTESGKKDKASAVATSKKKPTDAGKKPTQAKSKKPARVATGGTKKATKAAKKAGNSKGAKKMTPKKAKQPRSIKSPVARRARKAAG